jgi:hypothetical protein
MRFNYKKIAAIGASVLLAGMTTGFAAAAAFPAPFVQNGAANVAIVYGTGAGVSPLDVVQAGNIQSALSSYVGTTPNSIIPTTGEVATLDTLQSRIWLNASLNSVKQVLTNIDMPNTLAITNFAGNVNVQVSPTIVIGSGQTAGADDSGKVIFTKQPSSTNDPSVGVSIGTIATNPLYNVTLTFSQPVNFTDPGSQGQVLTLFGQPWTVSSSSSLSNGLVLFGAAQTVTLAQGTAGASTATVSINGTSHTVSLANVGTNTAYISVDGSSTQAITSGSSKLINGINVAVTSVASSTAGGNTATILVGANQLSFIDGQAVQVGTNNNQIQGTMVSFQGGNVNSTSKLTIAVFAPDTLHDAIVSNTSFVDPVFGGFQLAFGGLIGMTNYTAGSNTGVVVSNSGNSAMQVTFTNWNSVRQTVNFALNQTVGSTGYYNLSDANGNPIYPYEGANVTQNQYTFIGTANYGHIFQFQGLSTGSNNKTTWVDTMSGLSYTATAPVGTNVATLTVDGRQYTVTAGGSGASAWAYIKYPTSDSAAASYVLYPTIQLLSGAQLEMYAPLSVSMGNNTFAGTNSSGLSSSVSNFYFPNGNANGLTTVALTYTGVNASGIGAGTWTIGSFGTLLTNNTNGTSNVTVNVGKLQYAFMNNGTINATNIYLLQSSGNTSVLQQIQQPAIVDLEGKDTSGVYNAVVLVTQNPNSNSNLVGVSTTPLFTGTAYQSTGKVLQSNNKLTQWMDYMGTLITMDSTVSGQPVATLHNVANAQQAYAQLWIGSIGSTVGGSVGSLGQVLVKDSQVSSVSNDNLIVVGGSCINSAAATLVGGAFCGSDWTSATGVGSGQFLIQSFNSSINSNGLVALLVAGYDAPDTVNAATYLTMQKPDTGFGNKYIGTTSTSASLQVSH